MTTKTDTEQERADFETLMIEKGFAIRNDYGVWFKETSVENAYWRGYQAGRAALQSQDMEDAFCVWHNDPETDSTWETGCGNLFILNDGTPAENRMKFCCYCGKPIREAIDHARRIEGVGE